MVKREGKYIDNTDNKEESNNNNRLKAEMCVGNVTLNGPYMTSSNVAPPSSPRSSIEIVSYPA